jgi:hypothetical protein
MKLIGFRNAVVVGILPETKRIKDGISSIYLAISIPTVHRFIVFGKRAEAVSFIFTRRIGLSGGVAK